MLALRAENLSKSFGTVVAVNRLNLTVKGGEIFGLVGPDGAGKTTIMRMFSGILSPTSGEAWVLEHPITREAEPLKEKIGYMAQRFALYGDLTVAENIHFYADLYDVPKKERPPRVDRLLAFSNLRLFQDRLAQNLSGGMKQKLGLVCALIHTPQVLFLDEPTNGVDPVSRRDFWRILYDLLKEGVTIFVSTAYMDEAERCHRVGLRNRGRLIACDEPDRLKLATTEAFFEVRSSDRKKTKQILDTLPAVKATGLFGDSIHLRLETRERINEVLSGLGGMKVEVREIAPSLEDIFISMTQSREMSHAE